MRVDGRAVHRLVRATLEGRGQGDISMAALDVLVNCRRPIAIVTVAERLRLTPQSVGQTVAGLVRAGLPDKERDWNDRRCMLVERTSPRSFRSTGRDTGGAAELPEQSSL